MKVLLTAWFTVPQRLLACDSCATQHTEKVQHKRPPGPQLQGLAFLSHQAGGPPPRGRAPGPRCSTAVLPSGHLPAAPGVARRG